MSALDELPTPSALVDRDVLRRNLERMAARLARLGVALRPHVKTHKCVEIGEMQRHLGAAGVTVSTLREAAAFADAGFTDLTWAFPVILNRIREVREIGEAAAKQAGAGRTLARRFQVCLVERSSGPSAAGPRGACPGISPASFLRGVIGSSWASGGMVLDKRRPCGRQGRISP
jgi:D-serine deaminase-like pyridoxal phosphate-dependent protein